MKTLLRLLHAFVVGFVAVAAMCVGSWIVGRFLFWAVTNMTWLAFALLSCTAGGVVFAVIFRKP